MVGNGISQYWEYLDLQIVLGSILVICDVSREQRRLGMRESGSGFLGVALRRDIRTIRVAALWVFLMGYYMKRIMGKVFQGYCILNRL